jgi:predicted GIY-YIG superfamily endonuclease
MSGAYIYILGIGVTSNLRLRVTQHKEGMWQRLSSVDK